jgi:hypothetical protein
VIRATGSKNDRHVQPYGADGRSLLTATDKHQ